MDIYSTVLVFTVLILAPEMISASVPSGGKLSMPNKSYLAEFSQMMLRPNKRCDHTTMRFMIKLLTMFVQIDNDNSFSFCKEELKKAGKNVDMVMMRADKDKDGEISLKEAWENLIQIK